MKTATIRVVSYSRESTEQNVSDDAKSVTRQRDLAREFAETKGWTVVSEYADDGISGRRKTKLVSRNKMLADALADTFDVLVVRDLDRLSRNDEELPGLIYTLRDAGVEVWCYADGARVDTKTALSRLQLNIKGFAGSTEAEKASDRTRKQKMGRYLDKPNVDGKAYGYINVGEAKARRRVIEPGQAKVVKRIFELSANGLGLLGIVKLLNEEGVVNATGQNRAGSIKAGKFWATSGIREMLRRELYRGVSVYGKTRWDWSVGGDKRKVDVPEKDWLRVPCPELRIVSENL